MMAALRLAICRVAAQPLPVSDPVHVFPEWGHNIAHELTRTVFKGIVDMAPQGQRKLSRKIGRMIGLMLRMAAFYAKDTKIILEREGLNRLTAEQKQKIEKFSGWQLLLPQASQEAGRLVKTKAQLRRHLVGKLIRFIRQQVMVSWRLFKFVWSQPTAELYEFGEGFVEGLKCFLKPDGEFAVRGRRAEIYLLLLMSWPEIEEMRLAQPPHTRKYLLNWLEKQEGKQLVDSDKIFFDICDDISLDLAPPGHPFNNASA